MWTEAPRAPASRGRRSRNKVSVGEPAEGSLSARPPVCASARLAGPGLETQSLLSVVCRALTLARSSLARSLAPLQRGREGAGGVAGRRRVRCILHTHTHTHTRGASGETPEDTPGEWRGPLPGGSPARAQTHRGGACVCSARSEQERKARGGTQSWPRGGRSRGPRPSKRSPVQRNRRGGRLGSGIDEERSQL